MVQRLRGKQHYPLNLQSKSIGEIVSADSMQIYQDMNIGSAKPTKEEMQGIKHYMLDFVSPKERYSVADYKKEAMLAIEEIIQKGKTPIVVGGTGLYIDSLIYNIEYPEIEFDEEYRKSLEQRAKEEGLQNLYEEAKQIDPKAMERISTNDQKRILRVLELYHQTGKTKTQQEIESRKRKVPYDYYVYALTMERPILYDRINRRVDQMIEQGLIEEVQSLVRKYKEYPTAMQGLGYKEIKVYLEGKVSKEEAIETVKQETRRYAKRQLTWFKKNKQTIWLDALRPKEENIKIILEGIN